MSQAKKPPLSNLENGEIEAMALVLLRKYGVKAAIAAADFAAEHRAVGDHARARNWDSVGAVLAPTRTLS